jgi:hypothetical protein
MFTIVRNAALDELRRVRPGPIEEEPAVDLWRFDNASIAKITVDQGLTALAPARPLRSSRPASSKAQSRRLHQTSCCPTRRRA